MRNIIFGFSLLWGSVFIGYYVLGPMLSYIIEINDIGFYFRIIGVVLLTFCLFNYKTIASFVDKKGG